MTPSQIEISKMIASQPWFQWEVGMRDHTGDLVVILDDTGAPKFLEVGWDPEHYPFLGDPATDGCLHRQACDRWGAQGIVFSGRSAQWWNAIGKGRVGEASEIHAGRIPAYIRDAFPYHHHTAAVCAALLDGVS